MGNEVSMQSGRAEELVLLKAVLAGDVPGMQALLQQKQGLIYAHSKDGENIWHAAAQGGHPEMARAVQVAVDATVSGQNKQGKLRVQVNHGFNQVNQAMNQVIASTVPLPIPSALNLPMGASLDINAQTRTGLTPLMAAVKAGQADMVATLLQLGADAWLGDNSGATAVHHAARAGQTACLECLLRHGAKEEEADDQCSSIGSTRLVDTTTNTGLTPLHWAAWKGQCEAVKLLVNCGAAIAAASTSDTMGMVAANAGSTPLHLAAMKGEVGVVRLLLRANKKLMGLAAADASLAAAAADSSSGAKEDLRTVSDLYGKTAGRLAWDTQRSDLAVILDPKTPLDQAIQLATAASKTAAATAATAATAAATAATAVAVEAPDTQQVSRLTHQPAVQALQPPPQRKQPPATLAGGHSNSSSSNNSSRPGGRRAGEAVADGSPAKSATTTVAAATAGATCCDGVADQDGADGFMEFVAAPRRDGPEPPAHLVCPITNELLKDPVRACDGVPYERDAIEVWFQLGNIFFPGGHAPISSQVLTPDEALKQEANAWKAANTPAAASGSGLEC